jgi:hypothetical protein
MVLAAALPVSAQKASSAAREYQLKAAFLYNFAKFIEWPRESFPTADAPFVLCVRGDDPHAADMEGVLRGKTVAGRPLHVRLLQRAAEIGACHVLFVSGDDAARVDFALRERRSGVLTVGESADFLRRGGIIRLMLEDGKVRFEISPAAGEEAALRISSKLLKLAHIFHDGD